MLLNKEEAMKISALAAIAALSLAMMPGTADAGQKGKKQFTSHGNVHIGSRVSSKNLKALERQLKGHQKRAVTQELQHREQSYRTKSRERWAGDVGGLLATSKEPILGLIEGGLQFGRKRGH
jgi:hypothetical protein